MFRKLAVSTAALFVSAALLLGSMASPAAAMDYSLPYGSADCGTMSGPILPNEVTMYFFVYRVNGGQWAMAQNWMATYRTNNWEYVGGAWQYRQVNAAFVNLRPGDQFERWAFVYRASGSGWVDLGSCTQGGIVN